VDELVRRAAEPYRLAKPHPERDDLIACVDAVAGRLMRLILHAPEFQTLEAAWRGLHLLVRRLASGASLKIFLIDVSQAELAADFGMAAQLESSGLYRTLVEPAAGTPGGRPWGLLIGNYTFGRTAVDLLLAGCLARIAARAGTVFLAAASPQLVGCDSLAARPDPDDWAGQLPVKIGEAWDRVRGLPEAAHLGLLIPRFLARLPYGPATRPIESFQFEELPDPAEHGALLWANPGFAAAVLAGQAFLRSGWDLRLETATELEDLPLYFYQSRGEEHLQPCAETLLSYRAAERILETGLMPLLSVQDTSTVRLARWQSVARGGLDKSNSIREVPDR
jgi:type VI secretion system protein ImpC